MPVLDNQSFGGIAPKIADRKLPDGTATIAQNVRLDSGDLEPLKGLSTVSSGHGSNRKTIYKYGNFWFTWDTEVHAIGSPVAQDQYDRVYYTGDGVPKVTSNLIATGAAPYPAASYDLGVPQPESAPSFVTLNGADPDSEDFSDDETRFYVVTYVTEYGEEGPPSDPSTIIQVLHPDQTVTLNLPVPGVNTANLQYKNVYRTATSGSTTDFYFVEQVPLGTISYTDTVPGSALGLALETDDFYPPPSNMQGLVLGGNGIAAGFAGNELCFSEPYLPYAWPNAYKRSLEYNIVGIAVAGTSFIVMTEGNPYIFSGVSPDAMTETKLEIAQSCVSSRSIVDMGNYVIYASPDGLVGIREGQAELLTEKIFTKTEWAAYNPTGIHAYRWEDFYVAFGAGTHFIYDPESGDFTTNAVANPVAGFTDLLADELYVLDSTGQLSTWATGSDQILNWASKTYRLSDTSFTCAKIHTDTPGSITFLFYVDGALVHSVSGLPGETIRLPAIRGNDFKFQVQGTAPVSRITLATSMSEL